MCRGMLGAWSPTRVCCTRYSHRIEEIPQLLQTLMQVSRGPGYEELERSFRAYIRQPMLVRAKPSEPGIASTVVTIK